MSSSAEPTVPGFELSHLLGTGPRGRVYAATQLALGRRVALKLYPGSSLVPGRWPEHPGVARLFAAGTCAAGAYTASQLAAGGSLAQRLAARDITRARALRLCDEVEATLAALERPHGALSASNVLIDTSGRALLCDFSADPDPAADQRALAALRAACDELPRRTIPRRTVAAAIVLAAAGATATALLVTGDDGHRPPSLLPGVIAVGDPLTQVPRSVGCDGAPPADDAFACTLVQTRRDGRPFALPTDGIIRRWTVRGARGELALQLVRPVGGGRYVQAATTRSAQTALAGRRGDLVALTVPPGGAVGVHTQAGAATVRFVGRLGAAPPRRPQIGPPLALALRLELEPRRAPARPEPLTGPAPAPAGTVLARDTAGWDKAQTYAVVETDEAIVLDVFRAGRRTARITVGGAAPEGRLVLLTTAQAPSVRWQNPDGRDVERLFTRSAYRPAEVY